MSDFDKLQTALDAIFHEKGSPYACRTTEYENTTAFVRKLQALESCRPRSGSRPSAILPESPIAQLQFPSKYEPRYRVNVSIVPDSSSLKVSAT